MTLRHRYFDVLDWLDRNRAPIAACAVVTTLAIGALFVGSVTPEARGDTLEIAGATSLSPAAPDTTTGTTATAPTVRPVVEPSLVVSGATPPTRGSAVQVTDTVPAPSPVDGDCESWRPLLERYGIPFDEALPIMRRESACLVGAYNGNAGTRDASLGPFQVNRFGSLAAWWDEGGYTHAVMSTPEGAVAAAAVLYHSCGWAPWKRPYGCDGTYLRTPDPAWGAWPHQQPESDTTS